MLPSLEWRKFVLCDWIPHAPLCACIFIHSMWIQTVCHCFARLFHFPRQAAAFRFPFDFRSTLFVFVFVVASFSFSFFFNVLVADNPSMLCGRKRAHIYFHLFDCGCVRQWIGSHIGPLLQNSLSVSVSNHLLQQEYKTMNTIRFSIWLLCYAIV